tara:strand:+ start:1230 stop:2306 length:1077 start_codon:yes stop_codon:yes gene_type:complete
MSPDSDLRQDRVSRIRDRLKEISRQRYGCNADPELLTDKGLAHDHFTLPGTDRLFRVPKQSQMSLSPAHNLDYQVACFSRAEPGGSTPALHDRIEPDDALPFGALVVQHIHGRAAELPQDVLALSRCLAAIHSLPLPELFAPLLSYQNPLEGILVEIRQQAEWLGHPAIEADARDMIRTEIAAAEQGAAVIEHPALCLITFDAHPGNYILQSDDSAIIVDLEKMRYATPGLDLAHATLYTSTTWDIEAGGILTTEQVAAAYAEWLRHVPAAFAEQARSSLLAERRVMWLWSVTWCAKWLAHSLPDYHNKTTQNWSKSLSDDALTRHVADRVGCYLQPEIIAGIRSEWRDDNALTTLLR